MTSAEAVNALRALGYSELLTTEALAVSRPPTEGSNNPLTIILPLTMMVLTLILVLRISRRGNPAQRDSSNFKTIMPTAPPPTASYRRPRKARSSRFAWTTSPAATRPSSS